MKLARDRIDGLLWGLAGLWLAVFSVSMLHHTGGEWSLPLDDAFIYFQYASQAADGALLRYNAEDAPTTGATSLLYLLLLVPLYWLGFQGPSAILPVLLLGFLQLGASALLLRRLGAGCGEAAGGSAAGLLFLLCGPLLWGYYSGMEIGLFTLALLLCLYCYQREAGSARFARTGAAGCALALSRPEGALLALALGVFLAWEARRSRQVRILGWALLPLLVLLGQALFYRGLTGSWGAAGLEAKWRFAAPHAYAPEVLRQTLFDFFALFKGILFGSLGQQTSANLYAYDGNSQRVFFAPFFLLFFLLGLGERLSGEWRQGRPGPAGLAAVFFAGGLLATCTLVEYDAHYNRYQQPFLPIFILFACLGVERAGRLSGEWAQRCRQGLYGFFGGWGLLSVLFFAVAYGENCADIRFLQGGMARYADAHLPAGARLAINDAGVLRYLGGRSTVDLVGLTSPGMAGAWRQGSGSLYEALEALPEDRRPEYFAIFPNWFRFEEAGFLRPVHRVRLFEPSIVDAEKVLYRADWSLAHLGERLHSPALLRRLEGWRVVDRVDVADLESEAEHAYSSQVWLRGMEEANLLLRLPYAEQAQIEVVDGGRTVTGSERLVARVQGGRPARLLMRTVTGIRQRFAVWCQGRQVARVDLPGGPGRSWIEVELGEIPAALLGEDGRVEVETRVLVEDGAVHPIVSFHYWFVQP